MFDKASSQNVWGESSKEKFRKKASELTETIADMEVKIIKLIANYNNTNIVQRTQLFIKIRAYVELYTQKKDNIYSS